MAEQKIKAGDKARVWVNQAARDCKVVATLGDRALIRYEMPNGRDYLTEVSIDFDKQPGVYMPWIPRQAARLPKRWVVELERMAVERARESADPEADPEMGMMMEAHITMKLAGF